MRRYDDVVEVRLAPKEPDHSMPDHSMPDHSMHDQAPWQFVWRGRLYVVGAVLAQWVEVGAWWRLRDAEGLPVAAHATGRQVWRVEARAGRTSATGVYDLTQDLGTDLTADLGAGPGADRSSWSLARAFD